MTRVRIASIALAVVVAFTLQNAVGMSQYASLAAGAMAYFLSRYVGWVLAERQRIEKEAAQLLASLNAGPSAPPS